MFNFFKSKNPKNANSTSNLERKDQSFNAFNLYLTDYGIFAFANYSMSEIISDYERIAPLSTAISKLRNAVASLPIVLQDTRTNAIVQNHPAYKLFKYPNTENEKIAQEFIKSYITWKILAGDTYIMLTGATEPKEMYVLASDRMSHTLGADGYTAQLLYSPFATTSFYKNPLTGTYKSENNLQEIIHARNFNTNINDLQGSSELQSLFYEINTYLHVSKHNYALLKNGARPSGAFILKRSGSDDNAILSEEAFQRLKQEIKESYTGAENAGLPMVLEGGLEFQQLGMSPKDMDFDKLKKEAEYQIFKKLDIPVQLISSEATGVNNMSQLRLEFYQNRVIPMAEEMLSYFNRYILPRFAGTRNLEFVIDRDKVDVLLESRIKYMQAIQNSTMHFINEKRKMFKADPFEGGNVIVDPNGRHIAGPDAVLEASPKSVTNSDNNKTSNGQSDESSQNNTDEESDADD